MDEDMLLVQGVEDFFAGNESYARAYFEGNLYAEGIVSLTQLNGMEGFFSAIAEKVKQFCNWLWNKITGRDKVAIEKKNQERKEKIRNEISVLTELNRKQKAASQAAHDPGRSTIGPIKESVLTQVKRSVTVINQRANEIYKRFRSENADAIKRGKDLNTLAGKTITGPLIAHWDNPEYFEKNMKGGLAFTQSALDKSNTRDITYTIANDIKKDLGKFWNCFSLALTNNLCSLDNPPSRDKEVMLRQYSKILEGIEDPAIQGKVLAYFTLLGNLNDRAYRQMHDLGEVYDKFMFTVVDINNYEYHEVK